MINTYTLGNKTKQSGVVLFISLILLSVLTVLALTGMKTTIVDEKMSGNLRDNELAHQSAESALRDAETFINNMVSLTALTNTNGLYRSGFESDRLEPDYFAKSTWSNAINYTEANALGENPSGPDQLWEPAKYIIKHLGTQDICNTTGLNDPNSAFNTDLCKREIFRVTAYGNGASPNTVKILQAFFEKEKL